MKVLVVGNGGREHALVWKLAQSPRQPRLFCAPGNPGTARLATNIPIAADAIDDLLHFAQREEIDLTVVGPEVPLLAGIADTFSAHGLRIFGPTRRAAEIEGSKAFAKALMTRIGVPTARYAEFADYDEASAYLRQHGTPIVVKADGLAAGKGVFVAETLAEADAALRAMLVEGAFGQSGARVVLEEKLSGREASVMAFVSGSHVRLMPPAQDHKPVFDGNRGPNTGGMGTYSPVPWLDASMLATVRERILLPVAEALVAEGRPYSGVLYAGLMLTANGPSVIEFNARFGDPEAQVVLPRLQTDLLDLIEATLDDTLAAHPVRVSSDAAVCVILAAGGYPGHYRKGDAISGLESADPGVLVFHAGTAEQGDASGGTRLLTSGGRVLGVTGLGGTLAAARTAAYAAAEAITFAGRHYRTDIALEAASVEPLRYV